MPLYRIRATRITEQAVEAVVEAADMAHVFQAVDFGEVETWEERAGSENASHIHIVEVTNDYDEVK